MPTSRQIHLSKIFEDKKGVIGKVAGRYVQAGYSIEFGHPTRLGLIQIIARRGKEIIAIEVFDKGIVSLDSVRILHEKSRLLRAKPVLVLYGSSVYLLEDAKKYCEDNNIMIRKLRA